MENIVGKLYVGDDQDYERLKSEKGWSFLRCCKEGPGGHRETVGYKNLGAPKGKDYLAAETENGNRMALNFIDAKDPHMIPAQMVERGVKYIGEQLDKGNKVLVACNAGHSRGPTTAMLYLHSIGELPGNFVQSERVFHTLYHKYSPGIGVRQFARTHWYEFSSERKA